MAFGMFDDCYRRRTFVFADEMMMYFVVVGM